MEKTGKPRKLIIYLDQNVLSDTAKLGTNPSVRADFAELYQLLHRGFREEKLVAPWSIFHDSETSMSGTLKEQIRQRRATLGHVNFEHPLHIKERQIARAIQIWLGKEDASSVINFEDVFETDPDESVPLYDIDIDRNWMFPKEHQKRRTLADQLDKVRLREKAARASYDDLYKRELDWVRTDIAALRNAAWIAEVADVTVDEVRSFAATPQFSEVPCIHLDVALLARLMTQCSDHKISPSDVTDFEAMATYLPYCDAYITDQLAANVARSIDVNVNFGCALFDAGKQGVSDLIGFLKEKLAGSP